MRSDEPYVDHAIRVVDPRDQPILVAGDIEDRSTVAQDTGCAEIPFNVAGRTPIRPERMSIPGKRRLPSIGIRGLSAPAVAWKGQ